MSGHVVQSQLLVPWHPMRHVLLRPLVWSGRSCSSAMGPQLTLRHVLLRPTFFCEFLFLPSCFYLCSARVLQEYIMIKASIWASNEIR